MENVLVGWEMFEWYGLKTAGLEYYRRDREPVNILVDTQKAH